MTEGNGFPILFLLLLVGGMLFIGFTKGWT
jgi:hypothetical protein